MFKGEIIAEIKRKKINFNEDDLAQHFLYIKMDINKLIDGECQEIRGETKDFHKFIFKILATDQQNDIT